MPNSLRKLLLQWLKLHRFPIAIILATVGSLMIYLLAHMLIMKPTGLFAGHVHVWGDWSLHISITQLFAQKPPSEWFAYHPYFWGGHLTYPFLTHLISGLLMKAGWSLPAAFLLPSMVYVTVFLIGLYALYYMLLKNRQLAVASVCIFFLSSGPGAWNYFQDWQKAGFPHPFLPSHDYSRIEERSWLAGNWINGMLIPQRAFALGIAMMVWILIGYWVGMADPRLNEKQRRLILLVSGLGAGILPITHMHSFIVLVVVTGLMSLAFWKKWQRLAWYVVPAGLVSVALYLRFIAGGIENPDFMRIRVGWTAIGGLSGWIQLWWNIWGVFLPLAALGSVWVWRSSKPLDYKLFFTGFWVIFAIANVVIFQPIDWDNSKMFMWMYLALTPLVVMVLDEIRRQPVGLPFAVLLYFALTATGYLEVYRLLDLDQNQIQMLNTNDIVFGQRVAKETDSQALFLTEPSHNHPVLLFGARPIVMGYPGWAWNYGFEYLPRQADINTMYLGGDDANQLLKQYKVSYVVFGPGERNNIVSKEAYFSQNFPMAIESDPYKVYDVRGLWK